MIGLMTSLSANAGLQVTAHVSTQPLTSLINLSALKPDLARYNKTRFKMKGWGLATAMDGDPLKVKANSQLKITFQAGDGDLPIDGAGYDAAFNCERFTVKVLGKTQSVFVKKADYVNYWVLYGYSSSDPCETAPTSVTLDFSDVIANGHGSADIEISNAWYDNCHVYGDPVDGGCPINAVYPTHSVDGYFELNTK